MLTTRNQRQKTQMNLMEPKPRFTRRSQSLTPRFVAPPPAQQRNTANRGINNQINNRNVNAAPQILRSKYTERTIMMVNNGKGNANKMKAAALMPRRDTPIPFTEGKKTHSWNTTSTSQSPALYLRRDTPNPIVERKKAQGWNSTSTTQSPALYLRRDTPNAIVERKKSQGTSKSPALALKRDTANAIPERKKPQSRTSPSVSQHQNIGSNNKSQRQAAQEAPPPRIWNRNNRGRDTQTKAKGKLDEVDKYDPSAVVDTGIQTNELEITDYTLLIGDIKFLLPSKKLVTEIERSRELYRRKTLLKTQRKYEAHSERVGEHLTDLQEFLDKAVVTRRQRRPTTKPVELDHKLINSMDKMMKRNVPKSESITDIKERIRNKEKELLHLFDSVDHDQI